eukprot:SAG11_NODE_162_length_13962_cov_19.035562_2_plen_70_part_00
MAELPRVRFFRKMVQGYKPCNETDEGAAGMRLHDIPNRDMIKCSCLLLVWQNEDQLLAFLTLLRVMYQP